MIMVMGLIPLVFNTCVVDLVSRIPYMQYSAVDRVNRQLYSFGRQPYHLYYYTVVTRSNLVFLGRHPFCPVSIRSTELTRDRVNLWEGGGGSN